MKYCTDDGKHIFNTEKELFDYEKKVKAEKEAKAKLAEEKQARKDEINADYESLRNKITQYYNDYEEPFVYMGSIAYPKSNLFDCFDKIWRMLSL